MEIMIYVRGTVVKSLIKRNVLSILLKYSELLLKGKDYMFGKKQISVYINNVVIVSISRNWKKVHNQ
jgi:hypothetical protein